MSTLTKPGRIADVEVPEELQEERERNIEEYYRDVTRQIPLLTLPTNAVPVELPTQCEVFRPAAYRSIYDQLNIAALERALAEENDLTLEEFEKELGLE